MEKMVHNLHTSTSFFFFNNNAMEGDLHSSVEEEVTEISNTLCTPRFSRLLLFALHRMNFKQSYLLSNLEWCRKCILCLIATMRAKVPNRQECYYLSELKSKMRTAYSEEFEYYLVDLYVKSGVKATSNNQEYVRKGHIWKELGFQNNDPASDIRGGGLLSLENMLFFLQSHRYVAQNMIRKRAKGWETYETFPWAPASINLTRLVATEFGICCHGGQTTNQTEAYPPKPCYHLLLEQNGFSRIYVLAFLLLDKVWDECQATYLQFNSILENVRRELSEAMILASSLSELEEEIFNRVQYVPLRLQMIDSDVVGPEDDVFIDQSKNNNFFTQDVPASIYYPSIEELENFPLRTRVHARTKKHTSKTSLWLSSL